MRVRKWTVYPPLHLPLFAFIGGKPKVIILKNLAAFLLLNDLPNDLRFSLHRDLITINEEIANMLRDPKLAD